MATSFAVALAIHALPATAGAQDQGPRRQSALDAQTGEWTLPLDFSTPLATPTVRTPRFTMPSGAGVPAELAAPQDYSVSSMFSDLHGEFIQNANRFRQQVRMSFRGQSDTELQGENGEFDYTQFSFDGLFAFPVDPDSFVKVGGMYNRRDYKFSGTVAGPDEEVHAVGLQIGYGTFIREDLLIEIDFRPGLRSDFDGALKRRDWQFYGEALATLQLDEEGQTFVKGGLAVDQTFDETPVFPVLGLTHHFGESLRFDALLPRYVQVSWSPRAELVITAGAELEGDLYTVRRDVPGVGKRPFKFRQQELRLFLDGTWRFDDRFSVYGRFGTPVGGNYDIDSPAGTFDGQMEPAPFFEVGFGFDF